MMPESAEVTITDKDESDSHLCERHVVQWIHGYIEAWQTKDAEAAAELFTPDAVYEEIPGVPERTFTGRDEIRRYWREVTADQSNIEILYGHPLLEDNRAAVELWVTLRSPTLNPQADNWATIIEANVLLFQERLCQRNTEYPVIQPGKLTPPPGWGRARVGRQD
jgi:uncharacterized protein (TIGR02246 family)